MLAVESEGMKSMPSKVPFAGREAWTLDTAQSEESEVVFAAAVAPVRAAIVEKEF